MKGKDRKSCLVLALGLCGTAWAAVAHENLPNAARIEAIAARLPARAGQGRRI